MNVRQVLRKVNVERKKIVLDTSEISASQRKMIEAEVPDLTRHLINIRKVIDAKQNAPDYPNGYCGQITNCVFANLSRQEPIKRLQEEGVVFKKIWGIYDGAFQNAMQLGHLFINAAGDTVDPKLAATRIQPIKTSGYRDIQTYSDYLDTAKNYWELEAVPNYVFPFVSGFLPYIFIRGEQASFCRYHIGPLLYTDIKEDFRGAEHVMLDRLEGRTLTDAQLKFLLKSSKTQRKLLVAQHPKLKPFLTPQGPEKTEKLFKSMKRTWEERPHFPGAVYCLTVATLGKENF
jgi:hypothetical protein